MAHATTPVVRPYREGDEHGICTTHIASIRTLCAPFYTAEQIAVWSALVPHKYRLSMEKNNERFHVLDDNGTIAGFSGWYGDELQGFYLHPIYAGQGLGRKLYDATEADYRKVTGKAYWKLNSSLAAHTFYARMGFVETERTTQTFNRGGGTATLAIIRMRKDFTS